LEQDLNDKKRDSQIWESFFFEGSCKAHSGVVNNCWACLLSGRPVEGWNPVCSSQFSVLSLRFSVCSLSVCSF